MSITALMTSAVSGLARESHRFQLISNNIAQSSFKPVDSLTDSKLAIKSADIHSDMQELESAELSFRANIAAWETGASIWDVLLTIRSSNNAG